MVIGQPSITLSSSTRKDPDRVTRFTGGALINTDVIALGFVGRVLLNCFPESVRL